MFRSRRRAAAAAVSLGLVLALGLDMPPPTGGEELSRVISFQGRLTNAAGNPIIGDVSMKFSLYANAGDPVGSHVWQETLATVPVLNGVYNVFLGQTTPFPPEVNFGNNLWLGITVGTDPEMTPRYPLTPAPAALSANGLAGRAVSSAVPADGQVLKWIAANSKWEPATAAGGSVTSITLGLGLTGTPNPITTTGTIDLNLNPGGGLSLNGSNQLGVNLSPGGGLAIAGNQLGISFGGIVSDMLATGAVVETKIADSAVTSAKIVSLDAGKITGSLSPDRFSAYTDLAAEGYLDLDADGDLITRLQGDGRYVNVTGDTMTGTLNLPANGLVAGTTQLVLAGGNVGIGTASPAHPLHLSAVTSYLSVCPLYITNPNDAISRLCVHSGTSNTSYFVPVISGMTSMGNYVGLGLDGIIESADDTGSEPIVALTAVKKNTPSGPMLYPVNRHLFSFRTYNEPAPGPRVVMEIDAAGSVGIGTTSPQRTLDVRFATGTGHQGLGLNNVNGRHYFIDVADSTGNPGDVHGLPPNGFGIVDHTLALTRFVIDQDGNVGIGTRTPATKLEVTGTVTATGFSGPLTGTASEADRLDGQHGTFYQDAGNLIAGTLSTDRYSAYADLTAEGYLDLSAPGDLVTLGQADGRYVNVTGDTMSGALTISTAGGGTELTVTDTASFGVVETYLVKTAAPTASLVLMLGNSRTLRLEPGVTSPNLVGGYSSNRVLGFLSGVTIAGGGAESMPNQASGDFAVVGGGYNNIADNAAVVGGGAFNTSSNSEATVGGGFYNTASGMWSVVSGGRANAASGLSSSVAGGAYNTAGGEVSGVIGGQFNTAAANGSIAAGDGANIQDTHTGTFLFADYNGGGIPLIFKSFAAREFAARCRGGARFVTAVDGSGTPTTTFSIAPSGDVNVQGSVTATGFSGPLTGTAGNADKLDNLDSTQFLRSDASDSFTSGMLTFDAGTTLAVNGTFNASSVAISGGSINGTPIGATTPSTGAFTSLSASGGLTVSAGGTTVTNIVSVAGTLNFGSTAAYSSSDLTIAVSGASVEDSVALGVPNGSVSANSSFSAWVSATDTVTVRFNNYSSGSIDPASGTFRVTVFKF